MSERAHNAFLNLISFGIGIYGLMLLSDALGGDGGAFDTLVGLLYAVAMLLVAVGFHKRRGAAFLAFSAWLLVAWLTQFVRMIVAFDNGDASGGRAILYSFLLINVLIGYIGRWSMERRFRPHLEH